MVLLSIFHLTIGEQAFPRLEMMHFRYIIEENGEYITEYHSETFMNIHSLFGRSNVVAVMTVQRNQKDEVRGEEPIFYHSLNV